MRAVPDLWGILNVTPDSFSDGGRFVAAEEAVAAGIAMVADGAAVLDVGGESTRPGADPVPAAAEIARIAPVIEGLRAALPQTPLSIDTRHAVVAVAALSVGATIVNDVSAGADPEMFGVVSAAGAGLVLMHMRGTPRTMQADPAYDDVVAEVRAALLARVEAAEAAGIARERLWIDPGIGFGKTLPHNLELLRALESFVQTGLPVLLGASRKSFLGTLTDQPDPARRVAGSVACALRGAEAGVRALRVHDVRETRDALRVADAVR